MKYLPLGCALMLLAASASSQRSRMPRGSFLQSPATTTRALLRQFDSNPEVRRRYTQIFGRTRQETREILSRLKPKELTQSHRFPVAYYSPSGKWVFQERVLAKGTSVFVTPEGKPFLKEDCGNPLVIFLPYPRGMGITTRPPIRLPASLEAPPVRVVVTPVPSPFTLAPPEGEFLPPILSPPEPALAMPEPSFELVDAGPLAAPETLMTPGLPAAGGSPYWFGLLLPLLFLLDEDGDNRMGPPPPGPPVVPEASSLFLMVSGGLGILLAARRKGLGRPKHGHQAR